MIRDVGRASRCLWANVRSEAADHAVAITCALAASALRTANPHHTTSHGGPAYMDHTTAAARAPGQLRTCHPAARDP